MSRNSSIQNRRMEIDTQYSKVVIFNGTDAKTGRPTRMFMQDGQFSSGIYLDGSDLLFDYTEFYNLGAHFNPKMEKALMIGGAAYSYPKEFVQKFPGAKLDVVEIDPMVTDLAKKYFNLWETPNLTVFHEDGRTFLNKNKEVYDAIFIDAYNSKYSIPNNLVTVEAIDLMGKSLTDEGVVIVNVVSALSGEKSEFLWREYATYKKVFPQVFLFKTDNSSDKEVQNVMLIAAKSSRPFSFDSTNPKLNDLLKNLWLGAGEASKEIFVDDFAPVEYYINKFF
uniref:PABS domain-containing protein n=1 Tax=candidate division WWE3 bacterium TaxID=2053526 RepID=A0A7C4XGL5_UNCKA